MEQKAATNIGQDVPVLVRQLLSSNPRLKYKTAFRNLGVSSNKFAIVWCTYSTQKQLKVQRNLY